MKYLTSGDNELIFHFLRDLPYFSQTATTYACAVKSHDTNLEKTFLVVDVSPAPESYQLFEVTLTGGTESLSTGVVKLLPYGRWDLDVFSCSGTTLSDVTSTKLYSGSIKSSEL